MPEDTSSKQDKPGTPPESKRPRGRPVEKPCPERIEASPEEIAEMVLRMPPKKQWRYQQEEDTK